MSDLNIEDRIKNIIETKLQTDKFMNDMDSKKRELIKNLFEIFPELQEKNKFILSDNLNTDTLLKNEIILNEINYQNNIYYVDNFNGIWDSDAELVGVIKKDGSKNGSKDGSKNGSKNVPIFFENNFKLSTNFFDY